MKISYVLLDAQVVHNALGGQTHVRGVLDALSLHGNVSLIGSGVAHLTNGSPAVFPIEVKTKSSYLLAVVTLIWRDKTSDVFLFRKSLLGMFAVLPVIVFKRIRRSNQGYFIEFNGISGDFRINNPILTRFLAILNAVPLSLFDGVYCVNDNIRARLVQTGVVNPARVFVCPNGGSLPRMSADQLRCCIQEAHGVQLVYFGANQKHYHLTSLVTVVAQINLRSPGAVLLHLIGPEMEVFQSPCVVTPGRMTVAAFDSYVSGLKGMRWGVVPLDRLAAGDNVAPIKVFDYLSCGIPVFHSSATLGGMDSEGVFTRSYSARDTISLIDAISGLLEISWPEYVEMAVSALRAASDFSWVNQLTPLRSRITRHFKLRARTAP